MAVVVTPDDVAAGWRPLTDAEELVATQQIAEALVLLVTLVPGLDSQADDLVKLVVVRMVRRYMKNPDGFRSDTESIDDYSRTQVRDTALSAGDMSPWDSELAWLGVRRGGAFEIRLGSS
jgi:hypothetical protein